MLGPERAIRDYLVEQRAIYDLIGRQIYISRIPKDAQKTVLVLSRTSTLRDYSLNYGEELSAQALIGLDIYSRTTGAIAICYALAEQTRKVLSGFVGQMGDVYFPAITIDGEDYLSTTPQDGSDDWIHTYSVDYRAMYCQDPTLISYGG